LYHRGTLSDLKHAATAKLTSGISDFHNLVVTDVGRAFYD
jgi:hypothetical protein